MWDSALPGEYSVATLVAEFLLLLDEPRTNLCFVAPLEPTSRGSVASRRAPAAACRVGELIDGRYRVLELLSLGATAQVCRVRHRVLGRDFALKTLGAECARDSEWVQRLLREARALAALDHPNIVSVVDSGWLPTGEPYFVMEYVSGISLERWIAEGALEADVAVEVASGICEALEAAHGVGIVHRDLKPENIWVDRRGGVCSVKVLDFGLARVAGQSRLTRPRTTCGTPEYMSPEQAAGLEADPRSDIYSLGVVLYEMLCGRLPFEAPSYVGLAHQHRYAPVPAFRCWLPERAAALQLEPVVARCLEKPPERRFASALDVRRALAPFRVSGETLRLPRRMPPGPAWPSLPESAPSSRHGLDYSTLLYWTFIGGGLGALISCFV